MLSSPIMKFILWYSSNYLCIPIRAHAMVPTQRMPCRLWNTDYQIWENTYSISHVHVGLWGILWASIQVYNTTQQQQLSTIYYVQEANGLELLKTFSSYLHTRITPENIGWLAGCNSLYCIHVYMYIYTKLPITLRVCSRGWFQISCYTTSLIPRLKGGGKRTRYTMFAHALSSLGNLHTTPLH